MLQICSVEWIDCCLLRVGVCSEVVEHATLRCLTCVRDDDKMCLSAIISWVVGLCVQKKKAKLPVPSSTKKT